MDDFDLIKYLVREYRTNVMNTMNDENMLPRDKEEQIKELENTLCSTLEMICARYPIVDQELGEKAFEDFYIERLANPQKTIEELKEWDKQLEEKEEEDKDVRYA